MATAISNADARAEVERLAEEQAALRRVATLVARGITPEEVFQAVAAEVGVLFGSDTGAIVRFEDDRTVTVLGAVTGPHETGKRVTLDPGSAVDIVRETSRSARFDTDDPWAPDMPSLVQSLGIRSAVASPIVVEGELWGALTTASLDGPLPLGAERRLTEFTELVATAVANTQAREEVAMLADEQAALRQVAVARRAGAVPQRGLHGRHSGGRAAPRCRPCGLARLPRRRHGDDDRQLGRRRRPVCRSGHGFHWMATTSPPASSRAARRRECTATRRRGSVRQPISHGACACARPSGRRSSSRGSSGAR